jgi:uncharacterized protein YfaT (DUF1175 family)
MENSHLKLSEKIINWFDTADLDSINDKLQSYPNIMKTEHLTLDFYKTFRANMALDSRYYPEIHYISDFFYFLQNFHYEVIAFDNFVKFVFMVNDNNRIFLVQKSINESEFNNILHFLKATKIYE